MPPADGRLSERPAPLNAQPKANERGWLVPAALPDAEPLPPPERVRLQEALDHRVPGYVARAEHVGSDGAPAYTNRLILESSPYLLQHAHNPVNWYPWGDQAFEDARRLGRPVLLSIGYSTCHWCHVMERQSFENVDLAAFINANYIPIKVDREERPDIDGVYMSAIQLLGRSGGWPMTLLLTPDRQAFFGGTYFSPSALKYALGRFSEVYQSDPSRIVTEAADLTKRIAELAAADPAGDVAGADVIIKTAKALETSFDAENGGFGRAPKFPPKALLSLLMRYYRRSGDARALEIVTTTLTAMAAGGLHDQIGGGFHRYSTDSHWLVPHFEKMLYDNAQLIVVYLEAYQLTGDRAFARTARETLDYVARELTDPGGGFYSATDADSMDQHGQSHEGWFFTWPAAEIAAVLDGPERALVERHYGVTPTGNFEGRNILHVVEPLSAIARSTDTGEEVLRRRLDTARKRLYDARSRRRVPGLDNKVVVSWNGLMISAFALGAEVFGNDHYAEIAEHAARFLISNLRKPDGGLYRSWKGGRVHAEGVLDDYAFLVAGLIDLFETTSDGHYLDDAIALQAVLTKHFADAENGGFFFTAADSEKLLVREKPRYEGAEPTGNSVAISNLLRLAELTGDDGYRDAAKHGFQAFSKILIGYAAPTYAARMLVGLDYYLDDPKEIVIIKPSASADATALVSRLAATFVPNKIVVVAVEGAEADDLAGRIPLVAGKKTRGAKPTAYVCEHKTCDLPTTDPEIFAEQIGRVRAYAGLP